MQMRMFRRQSVRVALIAATVLVSGLIGGMALASPACEAEYHVAAGDSLGRIAKRCGMRVDQIMALNGLKSARHLRVGQVLKLQERSAQPVLVAGQTVELTGEIVNGRWCAQIRTPDGQLYGVVSPKLSFRSGAYVRVQGLPVSGERCTPGTTLVVSDLVTVSR